MVTLTKLLIIFIIDRLSLSLTRTLKLSEDVLGVCYSPNGRLLAVALLDSTIKVFFADTLKVSQVQGLAGLSND